ncbi:hypothetical protein [Streptomyces tubercidicus]|uniref:hypothetical protein n=1 Tax=Streptomyces tubercidicus TaxID=47759 RepID=UPI0034674FF7
MSDDGGNSDDSSDSGYVSRGGGGGGSGSGSVLDLSVLRRAMRWETFAVLAILVIVAAAAS